jgi:hypothetical protein
MGLIPPFHSNEHHFFEKSLPQPTINDLPLPMTPKRPATNTTPCTQINVILSNFFKKNKTSLTHEEISNLLASVLREIRTNEDKNL